MERQGNQYLFSVGDGGGMMMKGGESDGTCEEVKGKMDPEKYKVGRSQRVVRRWSMMMRRPVKGRDSTVRRGCMSGQGSMVRQGCMVRWD